MLTSVQIQFLLDQLSWETEYTRDTGMAPLRLQTRVSTGYRPGEIGKIQAALSIMLEAARRREGK